MHSSMIGKIEKAHRYAREPERIRLSTLEATFHGGHDDYIVRLEGDTWTCSCHTFSSHVVGDTCAHIMAMQQVLGTMLSDGAKYRVPDPEVSLVS